MSLVILSYSKGTVEDDDLFNFLLKSKSPFRFDKSTSKETNLFEIDTTLASLIIICSDSLVKISTLSLTLRLDLSISLKSSISFPIIFLILYLELVL